MLSIAAPTLLAAALAAAAQPPPGAQAAAQAEHLQSELSVQNAIAKVYPALVRIHVIAVEPSGGRDRKLEASGSGVIISADGLVVTNHHVAGHATALRCMLTSREELDARLVGSDPLADVAVIQLDLSGRRRDAPPLPVARFGSSAALRVGDPVLAMGSPLSLSQSVTKGIVANAEMMLPRGLSAQFRLEGEDVGSVVKWIGHDAQIQPGNSGGPLVNLAGDVVGINEIGFGTMSGAIPADLARRVAEQLVAHGKVTRSWLGVEFQPVLHAQAESGVGGVLVGGVEADSPAERAGLRAGDLITAVDGAPIQVRFAEELPALRLLLLNKPVGAIVRMAAVRDGKLRQVELRAQAREPWEGKEREEPAWGITARGLTGPQVRDLELRERRGVLVDSVRAGGPADQASPALRAGDVILEVDRAEVGDLEALERSTAQRVKGEGAPTPTLVSFDREGQRLLTVVELGLRAAPPPTQLVRKAWVPVATQPLSRKLLSALGVKAQGGVRVTEVYPHAPDSDGLRVGDLLLGLDGRPLEVSDQQDTDAFEALVRSYRIGSRVEFTGLRDGKPLRVALTLTQEPAPVSGMASIESARLEFKARDLAPLDRYRHQWPASLKAALVTEVEAGGWAAVAGLSQGDLVLGLEGEPVAGAEELSSKLLELEKRKPRSFSMLIRRGSHTRFLELMPKWDPLVR